MTQCSGSGSGSGARVVERLARRYSITVVDSKGTGIHVHTVGD
jgi:hypothetical protein